MNEEETKKAVIATLDKIRPFLRRDGGDIDLVGIRDGIVYVAMVGACEGCSLAGEDISSGIEIILMEEVPGIIGVKTDDIPSDLLNDYLNRKIAESGQESR